MIVLIIIIIIIIIIIQTVLQLLNCKKNSKLFHKLVTYYTLLLLQCHELQIKLTSCIPL